MELCTSVLCRPSCNSFVYGPFVEDLLDDTEILHSGEGRDVERWLKFRNNSLVFAIACVLFSIDFYFSCLCNYSSCIL